MAIPDTSEPLILFYFEGIVALCVARDPEQRHRFAAGIIKPMNKDDEIPKHVHSIEIKRLRGRNVDLDFPRIRYNIQNPARLLNFEIHNPSQVQTQPNVKLLRPSGSGGDLDRIAAVSGFDWVLDVEYELHGEEVNIRAEALRTVLRVNGVSDGIFYASDLGDGEVYTEDESGNQTTYYGAAESVTATIPLPEAGARLTVEEKGGNIKVFNLPAENGAIYYVTMTNTCHEQGCGGMTYVTDFYNALNDGGVGGHKRVRFIPPHNVYPPPSVRATPLTQCTVPDYGLRNDLPDPV